MVTDSLVHIKSIITVHPCPASLEIVFPVISGPVCYKANIKPVSIISRRITVSIPVRISIAIQNKFSSQLPLMPNPGPPL